MEICCRYADRGGSDKHGAKQDLELKCNAEVHEEVLGLPVALMLVFLTC